MKFPILLSVGTVFTYKYHCVENIQDGKNVDELERHNKDITVVGVHLLP